MRAAHVQLPIASFRVGAGAPKLRSIVKEARAMSITAINVRNQFRGIVQEIIEGPVVSEVDVLTPSGLVVTSVITTRSLKELQLAPGRAVVALVKSTEVALATL